MRRGMWLPSPPVEPPARVPLYDPDPSTCFRDGHQETRSLEVEDLDVREPGLRNLFGELPRQVEVASREELRFAGAVEHPRANRLLDQVGDLRFVEPVMVHQQVEKRREPRDCGGGQKSAGSQDPPRLPQGD
jgi:hypothetical protein